MDYLLKCLFILFCFLPKVSFAQLKYTVQRNEKSINVISEDKTYSFLGNFVIIYSATDPNLAMRPAGIKSVSYNVPTWKAYQGKEGDLNQTQVQNSTGGDGFDDRILKVNQKGRTPGILNSGEVFKLEPISMSVKDSIVEFNYDSEELFTFAAFVEISNSDYPRINFSLKPKKTGYFSVGYSGAPEFNPTSLVEIWQPLIWQEKRFPDYPYVTTAHMCTLPATLSYDGVNSIGVLAAPEYLPFEPLPLLENSLFGINLRDESGQAKSSIYAPLMGGYQSKMEKNRIFRFGFYLVIEPKPIIYTYEFIARKYFGFRDYRKNDISNVNGIIDNIIEYVQTKYAWYIDFLKGFSYSTDVPGAVKNVSSLNPIDIAIVTDNEKLLNSRGYPMMEFMLSREKTLFAIDSTQKIQSPSRTMNGKAANISELLALYSIFGKNNPFLLEKAKQKVDTTSQNHATNNYDIKWTDAIYFYKATSDKRYLRKAIEGANSYIKERVDRKQENFEPAFFWTKFTNQWIDLLQLYELTRDKKYLDSAHEGARYFAMFTYMTPSIPDSLITVNKGGKAPYYWYLKSKGHKQMSYPEEQAPAWRLSEIGLTPESSGTSAGHRAIFMSNFAPWMLRIGYYADDDYLKEVAKAAIIGRYRNFPGYHINTARTTAYEKKDYPLHEHKELSVNSFHYNHIMPMVTMLIDYLVSDAFVRSHGKINFPSEYVEGYGYLQNNIYGAGKGNFYGEKDVHLWMPNRLLEINNAELNYLSTRKDGMLLIAFTNQSNKEVHATVKVNSDLVKLSVSSKISALDFIASNLSIKNYIFNITVPANGIASVKLESVQVKSSFQNKILSLNKYILSDYAEINEGNAKAMLINLGGYSNYLFLYLEDDDSRWEQAELQYTDTLGIKKSILKKEYPFEFTVPVSINTFIDFSLKLFTKEGVSVLSDKVRLGRTY